MTSIFLSYRRKPSAILAQLLARDLKAKGIEVYLDVDRMEAAGEFPTRLLQAIESADVVICLIGAGTFESEWVQREIEHASRQGKPLIPVFQESYAPTPIEQAPTPFIKALLEHDGIHVFDQKNVYLNTAVNTLVQMVEKHAPRDSLVKLNIEALAGQRFGQYELREMLGTGGMGVVYRGYQSGLQRDVAVKILPPALASQPQFTERFAREVQMVARLEHPHIVPIYDYGNFRGLSCVVMRLLTGGSLTERIAFWQKQKGAQVGLAEIAMMIRDLAAALDYAHSCGVIHRDIKASNVIFDDQGSAFLVDFGIARLLSSTPSTAVGTPAYMAPEQWRGESVTPATDQYTLGVMVYSVITGRLPFEAPTPYGLMHKHLTETPAPLSTLRDDVPEGLHPVLLRAMAKNPGERYPSVRDFAEEFAKAIRDLPTEETGFFTTLLPGRAIVSPEARPSRTPPPLRSATSGESAIRTTRDVQVNTPTASVTSPAGQFKSPPARSAPPPTPPPKPVPSAAPMNIFISYRRTDAPSVERLYALLTSQGHQVWYDRHLEGGQRWWDEIIKRLTAAELLLVVLSPDYLQSVPCRLEYEYAAALSKRVLPLEVVAVGDYRQLPATLQEIQVVNGQLDDDYTALNRLNAAFTKLTAPQPLPSPLPPPPPAPISELSKINDTVDLTALGNESEQRLMISKLEDYLFGESVEDRDFARRILVKIQRHNDVRGPVLRKINALLEDDKKKQDGNPLLRRLFKRS